MEAVDEGKKQLMKGVVIRMIEEQRLIRRGFQRHLGNAPRCPFRLFVSSNFQSDLGFPFLFTFIRGKPKMQKHSRSKSAQYFTQRSVSQNSRAGLFKGERSFGPRLNDSSAFRERRVGQSQGETVWEVDGGGKSPSVGQ